MIETYAKKYYRRKDFIFKGTSKFYKTCTLIVQYTIRERHKFLWEAKNFYFRQTASVPLTLALLNLLKGKV